VFSVTGEVQDATPLVASAHVNVTVGLVCNQPDAGGAGVMMPEIVGASTSVPTMLTVALSPGAPRSSISSWFVGSRRTG
jgi:hypothetical protein